MKPLGGIASRASGTTVLRAKDRHSMVWCFYLSMFENFPLLEIFFGNYRIGRKLPKIDHADCLLTKVKYYHILKHCFGNSRNSLDLGFLQIFNGKTVPVCQGVDLGFGAKF